MSDCYIFNDSGSSSTYNGQLIADQDYYQIQPVERLNFSLSSSLLTDIGSGDAVISSGNTSGDHITDVNTAIDYLKNINQMVTIYAHKAAPDLNFRGKGISATVTKNTTQNIDYKLPEDREFDEVVIILKNQDFGDKIDLQFVDKDGVYYPAGTVLATFFYDYHVASDVQNQGILKVDYTGTLVKDLYLRFRYYSVGTVNDVEFAANLFLHKKG